MVMVLSLIFSVESVLANASGISIIYSLAFLYLDSVKSIRPNPFLISSVPSVLVTLVPTITSLPFNSIFFCHCFLPP